MDAYTKVMTKVYDLDKFDQFRLLERLMLMFTDEELAKAIMSKKGEDAEDVIKAIEREIYG